VVFNLEENRRKEKLTHPLKLQEAVVCLARLGGYLARNSDPPPVSKVLWLGLIALGGVVLGFRLARKERGP
jgi:hypothetical protein